MSADPWYFHTDVPDAEAYRQRVAGLDSWVRCGRCGKRMTLLVGGKADRPGDLHHCANCDPDPVEVWL